MKRRESFFINTFVLSAVNILMRTVGVSFTAYITGKIGEEGMGLFTLVMSIYGLAVTVATSGVNLAAVQLTAGHIAAGQGGVSPARKAIKGCLAYGGVFGISAAVLLYAGSDFIGTVLLGDARCVSSIKAMSLSLPAIALSSALAGYFTGMRKIWKNAVISITEQFVKIAIVCVSLIFLVPKGLEYACLGVVGGGAAAEGFSLFTSAVLYIFDRKHPDKNSAKHAKANQSYIYSPGKISFGRYVGAMHKPDLPQSPLYKEDANLLTKTINDIKIKHSEKDSGYSESNKPAEFPLSKLHQKKFRFGAGFLNAARLALPVAIGAYMRQGLLTAEHIAIPWGLRKNGKNEGAALADYGVLHGMVFPLLMFPSAVLGAVSTLLVPELSECKALGQTARTEHIARRVLRLTLLFAIGVSGIFSSFAHEFGQMIYSSSEAGRQLLLTAGLIPAMYLDSAVDGMLKGLGDQVYCMKVNIADSIISLVMVVLIVPRMGIDGYIIVLYAAELFNLTLSLGRLIMQSGVRIKTFKWIVLPFCVTMLICAALKFASAYPLPVIGNIGTARSRIAAAGILFILYAALSLKRDGTLSNLINRKTIKTNLSDSAGAAVPANSKKRRAV